VAGRLRTRLDVDEAFAAFEPHVLELATGAFTDAFDPGNLRLSGGGG
jgi:Na+-transporting NADH:ubiquinone oxidoreductase subunit C